MKQTESQMTFRDGAKDDKQKHIQADTPETTKKTIFFD